MSRISNFKDFYVFYLSEHENKTSRLLHFSGTALFLILFFTIVLTNNWVYAWLLPVVGYGFAWLGHFFFEKNKPATFKYPLWSLASDFVMFYQLLTGRLRF